MESLTESICSPENKTEVGRANVRYDLSDWDRWCLLYAVLSRRSFRVLHFLHVPKTGGTTLTAALNADPRFQVVSVDAPEHLFLRQLQVVARLLEPKTVLVRAHHGISLAMDSGVHELAKLALTTIRDPVEIHVSNANMIGRRIACLLEGQKQGQEEKEYAMRWLDVMEGDFEPTAEFSLSILASPAYKCEMGQVYSKMFDHPRWRALVRNRRIMVLDKEQLDEVMIGAFGYPVAPMRRNVDESGQLTPSLIPSRLKAELMQGDGKIFEFLKQNAFSADEAVPVLSRVLSLA